MKNIKKILALLVAVLMIAVSMSALAADGDFISTPESEITASGLVEDDTVSYYQLVEWDTTNSNWKLTALGTSTGVALADLIDGITAAEAATIANALKNETPTGSMTWDTDHFKATVNPGMYYLLATPDDTNTVYNPAFVSADYYEGGNTVEFSDSLGSNAYIKKSTIPFDKVVDDDDNYVDTKPGDTIPYKITTKIPAYGENFTNPKFKITDTLSDGLTMGPTVTVKYGDATTTASDDNVEITRTDAGFTVNFKPAYLKTLAATTVEVEITYSATVDDPPLETNVVFMDNKAKLEYSHTPDEDLDKEDITRHHYFSIDGDLLGGGGTKTHEILKIGVKPDGTTPIYSETTTYHENAVSTLAGATYTLTGTGDLASYSESFTTEADGHITFTGLKAGTYTLQETEAPAGFVKDPTAYTVVITPTYDGDVLQSYTVTFTGGDFSGSASFTATNTGEISETTATTSESASSFLKNTRGTELPSTGGIGTTIFYVGGSVLVLAAVILLVTKRRMNVND